MITNYFYKKENKYSIKKYDYFEVHKSFICNNIFKYVYNEVKLHITENSSRYSCVCISKDIKDSFKIYNLPIIDWSNKDNPVQSITNIKNKIIEQFQSKIDYGLVHYYPDENSVINWHSDREALRSCIYSISLGGTRRFCLRDKISKEVISFDLHDGDLFIMKPGCQEKYEHCIKSVK
jgi:hypothetical protein